MHHGSPEVQNNEQVAVMLPHESFPLVCSDKECKSFICSAPFSQRQTGDADYAAILAGALTSLGIEAHDLSKLESGEAIINTVLSEAPSREGESTVFHLLLDADRNGLYAGHTVTPHHLRQLKSAGVSIVVEPIEMAKRTIQADPKTLSQIGEYLREAHKVIFVDQNDQLYGQTTYPTIGWGHLSSIVSIPHTLDIPFDELLPLGMRPANFLSFGIIRQRKGIENEVVAIAKELRDQDRQEKVLVVGSLLSQSEQSMENSMSVFSDLLIEAYPWAKEKITAHSNLQTLVFFAQTDLIHQEPAINIEFLLHASDSELQSVFNRCRFALNFHSRGLSTHFSSVTNTLMASMPNFGRPLPEEHLVSAADIQMHRELGCVCDWELTGSALAKHVIEQADTWPLIEFVEKRDDFLRLHPLSTEHTARAISNVYSQAVVGSTILRGVSSSSVV